MWKLRPVFAAHPAAALTAAVVAGTLALGGTAWATGGLTLGAADVAASPTSSAAASTGSGGSSASGDSKAVVVNTNDDSYRYAISLKVVQLAGDTVDPSNAAAAVGSCDDCQTVAISLEGVLVYGDPSVFAPTNLALAYNVDCTNCRTLAAAYQVEQQYFQRCRITGAGRTEIARIRRDLEAIRQDRSLTLAQIDARVNDDAAALLQVLRTQVVPVGRSDQPSAAPGSTPGPDPSPDDTSPTPDASTEPSPSATPSEEAPSPSPTPTGTAGT